MSEIEEAIADSSTRLVNLNVRIPLFCEQRIELVRAHLQSKYNLQKISKQTTIEFLFREAFESLEMKWELEASENLKPSRLSRLNSQSLQYYPQNRY